MTTAAILHLASTVPPKLLFRTANFMSYNAIKVGKLAAKEVRTDDGLKLSLPENVQGLGFEPDMEKLREPILVFEWWIEQKIDNLQLQFWNTFK